MNKVYQAWVSWPHTSRPRDVSVVFTVSEEDASPENVRKEAYRTLRACHDVQVELQQVGWRLMNPRDVQIGSLKATQVGRPRSARVTLGGTVIGTYHSPSSQQLARVTDLGGAVVFRSVTACKPDALKEVRRLVAEGRLVSERVVDGRRRRLSDLRDKIAGMEWSLSRLREEHDELARTLADTEDD